MSLVRSAIPEAIKRDVRQRCGFGCVICGCPIFQIDHISDYAKVKEHALENLTALCPNHHADKTAGRLAESQVRSANNYPFNSSSANTAAYRMLFSGEDCILSVGSNNMILHRGARGASAITINQVSLLSFRQQGPNLLFTVGLQDERGNTLVSIIDNEVVISTKVWDVVWQGASLDVRATSVRGDVSLKLTFVMPNRVIVQRMNTYYASHHFQILPGDEIKLNNSTMRHSNNTFHIYDGNWSSLISYDVDDQGVRLGFCGCGGPPVALASGLMRRVLRRVR